MITTNQIFSKVKKKIRPLQAMENFVKAKREVKFAFSSVDRPPILIYQMGKVGSTTVYKSLMANSLSNPILHLHFLSPDLANHRKKHKQAGKSPPPFHIYLGEAVSKFLNKNRDFPIKIISLVRDPIALQVSGLFQNQSFHRESIETDEGIIDTQKIIDYLYRELLKPEKLGYIYEWFDRELKRVFGIDVFASPFPIETGYAVYSKGNVETLVIRLEDLSEKGPKAISEFLCLDDHLVLKRNNVRNASKDAAVYHDVLKKICISQSVCREIYSSRFVMHFYSKTEINELISNWTKSNSG